MTLISRSSDWSGCAKALHPSTKILSPDVDLADIYFFSDTVT